MCSLSTEAGGHSSAALCFPAFPSSPLVMQKSKSSLSRREIPQLENSLCTNSFSLSSSLNGWRHFGFSCYKSRDILLQSRGSGSALVSYSSCKTAICSFSSGHLWQNIPPMVFSQPQRAAGFLPPAAAAAESCAGVCRAGACGCCGAPETPEFSLRIVPPASGQSARTAEGRVDTKGTTAKATAQPVLRDTACEAACVFCPPPSPLLPTALHSRCADWFSAVQMKFMAAGAARLVNILWSVKLFYITWFHSCLFSRASASASVWMLGIHSRVGGALKTQTVSAAHLISIINTVGGWVWRNMCMMFIFISL